MESATENKPLYGNKVRVKQQGKSLLFIIVIYKLVNPTRSNTKKFNGYPSL
jgi:hypothetical protein